MLPHLMGHRIIRLAAIATVSVLTATSGRPAMADDLSTVRDRIVNDLLKSVPSASTVNGYRSDMASNGSWADVSYSSKSRVSWEPMTHLSRLTAMAEAYSSSGHSLYRNTGLRDDILKAYNYWTSRDPTSDNWFYNEISAPQELGNAMVLINGLLSSSQRSSGLEILERAYRPRSSTSVNTGMNRVERAMAGISRGIVAGSDSITADAFAAIGDAVVVTTGEGIQRDGSFHQHGSQLYNSGYGSDFISSAVKALSYNSGTDFGFSSGKQQVLIDHLLDGTQWMIRGQVIDYTASGRSITRKGQDDSAASLSGQLQTVLNAIPDYRAAELKAFRSRILAANDTGSASASLSLSGNRHFWQSDLTVHQRPDYYASVKTSSTRTTQPETGNNEGLKSLYMGDGVNLIMRTGNEYDNIMPVWNWRRLPGTTVEQNSRSLKPADEFGVQGTSTYAGGVSDGVYGTSAFRYDRYNVDAKKSWFFFDQEFVALGASINAPNSVNNVNTTVNQTLLKGTVSYKTEGGSRKTLALGDTVTPDKLQWVFHDGVGYFFPTPVDNATFRAYTQTGTWASINERYDDSTISKDVFTLYVNHGNGFTGGAYNYIVVPGMTVGEMDGYLADNPIDILKNNGTVQAIRQSKRDVTQAAFYAASSLSIGGGQSFAVNNPSTVIMRRPTDAVQFTASSPEAKVFSLAIDLNAIKFTNGQSSWLDGFSKSATLTLGLPEGDRAGSSVGIAISTDGAATPTIRFTTYDQPTTFRYVSDAPLALPANTTLYAGSNKTLTFNGVISGNAQLTKSGESDLRLTGENTYSGGTRVLGGTVSVSGDQRGAEGGWIIGPSNDIATTVTFNAGSRVRVAAGGTLQVGADGPTGETRQILNANGLLSNYGTLAIGRHAEVQVNGTWSQTGEMSIAGKGDAAFSPILSINNGGSFTYTGSSTIKINPAPVSSASASLIIGNSAGAGSFTTNRGFERTIATGDGNSIVTLRNGGSLVLSADVPELTRGAFQFRLGDGGGVIDTAGFDTSLAASLSNITDSTGGLTKRGNGTLELLAGSSYRGNTVVADGALRVSNVSGSATGTGSVSIEQGASLGGNGRISGAITIKNGATLTPGASAGTLTTGAQTWAGGGSYVFDIAGVDTGDVVQSSGKGKVTGSDWVVINGVQSISATAANPFHINISSDEIQNWDPALSYTWILSTASGGINGFAADRFSVDLSGSTEALSAPGNWSVSRSGNELLLHYANAAVPEPAGVMTVAGVLAGLLVRRRTRNA